MMGFGRILSLNILRAFLPILELKLHHIILVMLGIHSTSSKIKNAFKIFDVLTSIKPAHDTNFPAAHKSFWTA